MGQIKLADRFRNVARFLRIKRTWRAFTDGAEATMPRTDVAAQHECGSAIRPAFEDIWATGLLTDSVEIQALDQTQHMILIRRIAQTDLQPLRLWLARLNRIADHS